MEERFGLVEEWNSGDWSMVELCRFYGVTRVTGYQWLGRFESGGLETLRDRRRAPAEAHFDVFITAARNVSFQQNLTARSVAVVVLVAPTNRLESLGPLVPAVLDLLPSLRAGQLIRIV